MRGGCIRADGEHRCGRGEGRVKHLETRGPREMLKRGMGSASQNMPLRIVSIGGGTGLSTLLRGLKRYVKAGDGILNITAVVTVTDDGGSSGRLRREFDVLPPGDIRNCMVALSEDENLLSRLFQYRFSSGRGLKGHSFGNLFLTAMTHLTGDFTHAIRCSAEVLAVLGNIYPSTGANVALEAIANADLITLGPGSLFTSVIPNLLVAGIPEAIAASKAYKAYFMNLMSQPGETTNFRASDHVEAIYRHAKLPMLDVCVLNTRAMSGKVLDRYRASAARPVENDVENLERLGLKVIATDLLRMSGNRMQEKIRHDSSVIGAIAFELAQKGHKRKSKKR